MTECFHELDRDQGIERIYPCYKDSLTHVQTEKQRVDLVESTVWGQMLFLDGVLQSTTKDEILYHSALVHPLLDTLREKKNILILGGGEGATAREVLRWKGVESVTMVEYDKELVDLMKEQGSNWSQGAFNDTRLNVIYDDAWAFMERNSRVYNGVIVDLTDPDLKKESWKPLLENVLRSVKGVGRGGFVLNAGLYTAWDTEDLKEIKEYSKELCQANPEFKYYMYTTFIPSFNGEWTFIVVSHISRKMIDPEDLNLLPKWIRRSIRMLDTELLDEPSTCIHSIPSEIVPHL